MLMRTDAPTRRSRGSYAVAAIAAAAAFLASIGTAQALPTVSGTLRDSAGKPFSGEVMVSLHPDAVRVGQTLPSVGSGTADGNGRYTATITDTATVSRYAAEQGGQVELWVDPARELNTAHAVLLRRVEGEGDAMELIDPQAASRVHGTDPDGTVRGGPIMTRTGSTVGLPMLTGRPQLVGFAWFSNTGRRTATLESVRPLDLSPSVTIRQTLVAGEDRRSISAGGATRWPNRKVYRPGTLKPVAGFKVTPDRHRTGVRGTNVAFVVEATEPGTFGWQFVEVRYRIGQVRYRRLLDIGFHGCFGAPRPSTCYDGPPAPSQEDIVARYDQP